MKYTILFSLLLLISCNETSVENKEIHNNVEESDYNRCCIEREDYDIWTICFDSTGEHIVKGKKFVSNKGEYLKVISAINKHFPLPGISFQKIVKDTIYLQIDSSKYFTQQMGTTGSMEFEVIVVYSLTESKEFNYVHFDFIEGDHGGLPISYARDDFAQWYSVWQCN